MPIFSRNYIEKTGVKLVLFCMKISKKQDPNI